jgi:hypothetical protein
MQQPGTVDDVGTAPLVAAIVALGMAFSLLTYWTTPFLAELVQLPNAAPRWWWPATGAAVFVAVVAVAFGVIADRLEREKKQLFRYLADEALQRARLTLELERLRRQG